MRIRMFAPKEDPAEAALKQALEAEKFVVFPVNPNSQAYREGLRWGTAISWPAADDHTIKREIETILDKTRSVAAENGRRPMTRGPVAAAGGCFVIYCGFAAA